MQLKCRNCGAIISAENINIQQMAAVCSECNHVFSFADDLTARKAKSLKVKRPKRIHVQESTRQLELSYNRVLNQDDAKGVIPLFIVLCLTSFFFILATVTRALPLIFVFAVLVSVFAYILAETFLNRTRVAVGDETITTWREPLPFPMPGTEFPFQTKMLNRHEAVRVFAEETVESREKGEINRYYHVCIELHDGNRAILLKSLPHDYAFYIAQRLDAYLQADADEAAEALSDDVERTDDEQAAHLLATEESETATR